MKERKEYDKQYHQDNIELRKAQMRVRYLKNREAISAKYYKDKIEKIEKELMETNNEINIIQKEGDNLATFFAANAIKLAVALSVEDYETCEELRKEKNQYIYTYLGIINLYLDVDDYEVVVGLDNTYEGILQACKDNLENIIKEDLHKS